METEGPASNEINTGLIASIAVLIRLTKIRQLNCHQVRSHGVNTPPTNLLQCRIAINVPPVSHVSLPKKIQVDRLDASFESPSKKRNPRVSLDTRSNTRPPILSLKIKFCWKFIALRFEERFRDFLRIRNANFCNYIDG